MLKNYLAVTLKNSFAGGASVHFQILSAESRKYFRNAIVMSGTADNFWAMSIEENHLKLAHQMAEDLNKTVNSFDELVSFLKEVPIDDIHIYALILNLKNDVFQNKVAPVIESKI